MRALLRGYFRFLYGSVTRGYTKALFGLLEKNPGAVLVDAGCWDGVNSVEYGRAVGTKSVVGLEIVGSAAKKARERGIRVVICDLNSVVPLKSSSVDVVVSNHVIEHLYNVAGFVGELYRVMRPGGCLVLGTPNLASWHNVFALVIGRQPFSGPTVGIGGSDLASEMKREKNECLLSGVSDKSGGEQALGHIVVMTCSTLVRLLKSKGFVIEKSLGFGYHPFPPFIAGVLALLDKSHSHYVLIKARKPQTAGKSL